MLDTFPDVIRIEPAGICNFKCTHCPVGREGGKRVILRYENFVRFLDMLPLVPRVLVLYHGGEPLLNRNIIRMIDHAKSIGVHKVVLNTNASMIEYQDFSNLDEMRVSFDGTSIEQNNDIRIGSDFLLHGNAVRRLASSDRRPKQITIYNANNGRVSEYLIDYFSGYDVHFRAVHTKSWARIDNEPDIGDGVTYCSNLWETFTILSNGDVPMCCEDLQGDDIQANVFQNSPVEIWNMMQERRNAFSRKEYPKLCQSCWKVTGKYVR